jgi:Cys-Gly metallodipeptidase DUG1
MLNICLKIGHYDVQPASLSDGWITEPFKLVENKETGRMYGRGSTDDKGPHGLSLLTRHQSDLTDSKCIGPVIGWINVRVFPLLNGIVSGCLLGIVGQLLEAYQKTNTELPVNLKFLLEGMEESGSLGLDKLVIREAKGYFKEVDAVCVSDNYWFVFFETAGHFRT